MTRFQKLPVVTTVLLCMTVLGNVTTPVAFAETQLSEKVATASVQERGSHSALYGETSAPDQVGQTYMVLERTGDRVIGAFYQPLSSFDCFDGQVEGDRLALSIRGTYTDEIYDYAVALSESAPIASTDPVVLPLQIQGFQPLAELSANDQRILSTCKAAIPNQ